MISRLWARLLYLMIVSESGSNLANNVDWKNNRLHLILIYELGYCYYLYYQRGQNIAIQTPINAILPPDISPISGFVPSNNQPNT
jgi:hypothetical protein